MRRSSNKILLNFFSDASMLAAPVKGCLLKITSTSRLLQSHTITPTPTSTPTPTHNQKHMQVE